MYLYHEILFHNVMNHNRKIQTVKNHYQNPTHEISLSHLSSIRLNLRHFQTITWKRHQLHHRNDNTPSVLWCFQFSVRVLRTVGRSKWQDRVQWTGWSCDGRRWRNRKCASTLGRGSAPVGLRPPAGACALCAP